VASDGNSSLITFSYLSLLSNKEPIKTVLTALIQRDAERASVWLQQRERLERRASEAVMDLLPEFAKHSSSDVLFDVLSTVFLRSSDRWERQQMLRMLGDLMNHVSDDIRAWQVIRQAAMHDPDSYIRQMALVMLASGRKNAPET
jgi:hypothetical protein